MKKKQHTTELKTKHLVLRPLTDEELRARRDAQSDEGLYAAYDEMLSACLRDEEHRLWYTAWTMLLRKDRSVSVGDICFKGPANVHEAELGYGVEEAYRLRGYATEATEAMRDWAFGQDESLYLVTAEAEETNAASLRVLEKAAFKPLGIRGEEGPRFYTPRPKPSWMSVYLCLGLSVGLSLGSTIFDSTSLGMCFGMGIGMTIGSALDRKEKEKRLAALAEWEEAHAVRLPDEKE